MALRQKQRTTGNVLRGTQKNPPLHVHAYFSKLSLIPDYSEISTNETNEKLEDFRGQNGSPTRSRLEILESPSQMNKNANFDENLQSETTANSPTEDRNPNEKKPRFLSKSRGKTMSMSVKESAEVAIKMENCRRSGGSVCTVETRGGKEHNEPLIITSKKDMNTASCNDINYPVGYLDIQTVLTKEMRRISTDSPRNPSVSPTISSDAPSQIQDLDPELALKVLSSTLHVDVHAEVWNDFLETKDWPRAKVITMDLLQEFVERRGAGIPFNDSIRIYGKLHPPEICDSDFERRIARICCQNPNFCKLDEIEHLFKRFCNYQILRKKIENLTEKRLQYEDDVRKACKERKIQADEIATLETNELVKIFEFNTDELKL